MFVDELIKALQEVPNPSVTRVAFQPISAAATGEADTELFTDTAHGLAVGDAIVFHSLTGGTGLAVDTVYWVLTAPDANTFTVAATPGGATTAFSTDVTASVYSKCSPDTADISGATAGGIELTDGDMAILEA